MTVVRVNCLLCSHKALDFLSYKQHIASFHQVISSQEVLLAVQLLEEKDRISLVEKTKTEVINFRGNGEARTKVYEPSIFDCSSPIEHWTLILSSS